MLAAMTAPASGAVTTTGVRAGAMMELKPDAIPGIVCDGQVTLEEVERRSIVATLEQNKGHRQKSAKALGIGVRTLGLKLKKWKEDQIVEADL